MINIMISATRRTIAAFILLFPIAFSYGQNIQEGLKLLDYQKYEAAKRAFKEVAIAQPDNPEGFFRLGEIYFMLENDDSSKLYYEKSYQVGPVSFYGIVSKARKLIMEGDTTQARSYVMQAMKLAGPKEAELNSTIARSYLLFTTKNPQAAIDILLPLAEKRPTSAELYMTLGDAYLALPIPNGSKADEYYGYAVELEPNSPKTNVRMGQLYNKVRNPELALEYFEKAYALDSLYPPVYPELAEMAFRKRMFTEARNYYDKYLQLVENDPEARKRYVGFLYLVKEYDKAIEEASTILAKEENPIMYRLTGYSYTEMKMYAEAKAAMDKYFAIYPEEKVTALDYEYYGRIHTEAKQDSIGVVYLKKALAVDTSRFNLNLEIAKGYKRMKKYDEAAMHYKLVAERTPSYSIYYDLGLMYYEQKQFDSALVYFGNIKTLHPEFYLGYLWTAYTLSSLDPTSEKGLAKEEFEALIKVIEADKEPAKYNRYLISAYSYLGYYHFLKKDDATAKVNWTRVKELDPNNEQADKFFKYLADKNKPQPPAPKR